MKLAMMGAVVAVAVLASDASGAKNTEGTDMTGRATHRETQIQGAVQCDVMRDYYYNVDTGEWISWAGDAYVTNCVPIGGSGTNPTGCMPGDFVCLCERNPSHPFCQGGGGGNDCKTGVLYSAGSNDPICPPTPPVPKNCKGCIDARDAATATANALEVECRNEWAMPIATAKCDAGLTVRGYWDPFLEQMVQRHGGNSLCVDIGGEEFCETFPAWEQCYQGWMQGDAGHTNGTSNGNSVGSEWTTGAKVPGGGLFDIEGSIGGSQGNHNDASESTTVDPVSGLVGACGRMQDGMRQQAWLDYVACSQKAPDRVNGSCSGHTNNGSTN